MNTSDAAPARDAQRDHAPAWSERDGIRGFPKYGAVKSSATCGSGVGVHWSLRLWPRKPRTIISVSPLRMVGSIRWCGFVAAVDRRFASAGDGWIAEAWSRRQSPYAVRGLDGLLAGDRCVRGCQHRRSAHSGLAGDPGGWVGLLVAPLLSVELLGHRHSAPEAAAPVVASAIPAGSVLARSDVMRSSSSLISSVSWRGSRASITMASPGLEWSSS
jgi:hypothetical protein